MTPNNLKSEALSILAEIPHTFISIANADNARPAREHFIRSLRDVHRWIATAFGEPRPQNLGVLDICDDLTRWVNVWTWHPHADHWVAQLRHILHVGNRVEADADKGKCSMNAENELRCATSDSELRWIDKPDAVCPSCLTLGHLRYQEDSWDHYCPATRQRWEWKSYRDAVKRAVAELQFRRKRGAA